MILTANYSLESAVSRPELKWGELSSSSDYSPLTILPKLASYLDISKEPELFERILSVIFGKVWISLSLILSF
jgi:hypothetical protein